MSNTNLYHQSLFFWTYKHLVHIVVLGNLWRSLHLILSYSKVFNSWLFYSKHGFVIYSADQLLDLHLIYSLIGNLSQGIPERLNFFYSHEKEEITPSLQTYLCDFQAWETIPLVLLFVLTDLLTLLKNL